MINKHNKSLNMSKTKSNQNNCLTSFVFLVTLSELILKSSAYVQPKNPFEEPVLKSCLAICS